MHNRYLACFNFECKDEVCWELKLAHLMVFAKVLTTTFIFLPATYLHMHTMTAKLKQTIQVYRESMQAPPWLTGAERVHFQNCASKCSKNALPEPSLFLDFFLKHIRKLLKFTLQNTIPCGWFLENSYIHELSLYGYKLVRAVKSNMSSKDAASSHFLHHLMTWKKWRRKSEYFHYLFCFKGKHFCRKFLLLLWRLLVSLFFLSVCIFVF